MVMRHAATTTANVVSGELFEWNDNKRLQKRGFFFKSPPWGEQFYTFCRPRQFLGRTSTHTTSHMSEATGQIYTA
jgi:hypothetical protein